jgi:integrase
MKTASKKWEARCFRDEPSNPDGIYFYKPMYRGRRESFSTGTPVRAIAGLKARDIFMSLRANGWGATMAKYTDKKKDNGPVTTLGEFVTRVESTFDGQRRTITDYVSEFRKVAGEISGIVRATNKYNTSKRKIWVAKTDKIRLDSITREKIETWRVAHVATAGDDLNRIQSRKTTCNSILRRSAALFTTDRLERAGLTGIANPFAKIKPFPAGDHRYRGGIDPAKIFKVALFELADKPELLKALTLGLCCGLRRNEIDKLEWNAFDFDQSLVRVGPTAVLHVKGKRIGEVAVEPEILGLFRGWHAKANGSFVLESEVQARPTCSYNHYRCASTFAALSEWLRKAGVTSRNPVHELRKMFGSQIYLAYDLLAASVALRHSNVATTAGHYLVKRPRVTVGFGALVTPENVVAMPTQIDTSDNKKLHIGASGE